MSEYSGRKVLAEIAGKYGWKHDVNIWPNRPDGIEFDTSTLGNNSVVIGWTAENTAPYVSINGNKIPGMGALITVRRFIESVPISD